MNNTNNEKQKKMLLILPLLAIPFATMFFWALGGGKPAQAQQTKADIKGLNMQLPGAKLKNDSAENKLGFYEQAEKDSLKYKQARKDDPYYKENGGTDIKKDSVTRSGTGIILSTYSNQIGSSFSGRPASASAAMLAADEQQINQKLSQIRQQINQPPQPNTAGIPPGQTYSTDSDLSHLQETMQKLNSANTPDPQMEQLSGMLDKILDIEHPELARQKIKARSEKEKGIVLPVSTGYNGVDETLMRGTPDSTGDSIPYNAFQSNGFYGLDQPEERQSDNSVAAIVHETQTLMSGSTVKLRLLQDIYINGRLIPRGNFVFGSCTIEGERLNVDVRTIRYHNSIFPVSMRVFDQDGLPGIYVPGAITRDAVKEGTDQAVQSYDPLSYDPSLGAQAATAGISIAKGIFSKKVKLIKVIVKAGYSVFLLNGNQFNQ